LFVGVPLPLSANPVEAGPARRVLLVVDKPGDPFVDRIKAELTSLGLNVVTRAPVGPLEADARDQHAIAAIRVLPSRKGVEVWMADETSGRSLLRQVVVDETPGGPNQSLVALQTAELLRTSLFPRPERTPPAPAAQIAAAPPAVVELPPAAATSGETGSSREVGARAGFGFLYSAGGTGTALQVWLSLHEQMRHRLAVALNLSGPVRRSTVTGIEGSANLGVFLAGGEVSRCFETNAPRLFLTTGVGAALAWVSARGQTQPPLLAATSSAFAGLGYARVDAGWRVAEWLRFGITAALGATFDRVTIRFAGNDAATWGWPILASFLFGEVDF
jgi:hypothetical protein